MKHILIAIMTISSLSLFGQIQDFNEIPKDILEHLDKMGVDDSPLLNSYEAAYFNMVFKKSNENFDFVGKKIGFITGTNGKTKSNKADYFKLEKDRYKRNYSMNDSTLDIFDAAQKEESGGYDAVIVYWTKIFIQPKDMIKILKKNKN